MLQIALGVHPQRRAPTPRTPRRQAVRTSMGTAVSVTVSADGHRPLRILNMHMYPPVVTSPPGDSPNAPPEQGC
ncbi:hypothetical protein GCM10009753_67950 [Streptantibioticus ferralitis]